MKTNEFLITVLRFILLILVQVILLNNINLMGYVNPYIYLIFIILYPFDSSRELLIFLSFLLGITIDIFDNSGGIHAAASVFTAYIRPVVLKYSFGISYEYDAIKLERSSFAEKFSYIASLVFIHHLVLFLLEAFSFRHMVLVLKSVLFSGLFTLVVIFGTLTLFKRSK